MNDERIEQMVSVWQDMGRHVGEVSAHMVRNLAAQTTTERAARESASAVKLAAFGALVILAIGSLVIGTMVQASITVSAHQREGILIEIRELEASLQRHNAICRAHGTIPEPTR